MKKISIPYDSNVIVGMETSDDAGVYRLTGEIALIQTLDFFTPIVDDPFVFGQIAAANGLSDVYAMGGKPLTAMNIVCFPTKKFSLGVLGKILDGGLDILKKAGVQLLGGHSVEDEELKYGISVTGIVHPERALKNRGIQSGDAIVLTKGLGTGIIGTAVKAGVAEEAHYRAFVESMTSLNKDAAEAIRGFETHACTDVTGFGLAGHLKEMLADDSLEVMLDAGSLPVLPGALEYASQGFIPGGLYRNRDYVGGLCAADRTASRALVDLIFDPQTSGGLLIALPEKDSCRLVESLRACGVMQARVIARAIRSDGPRISLSSGK